MKVTKFGHCCLLIEVNNIKILTDPGEFSTLQDQATQISIVLITHEHADHLHVDSLKRVLQNNPLAKVITNSSVGKILSEQGILFSVVEDGQHITQNEILIEGHGESHALVYEDMPRMMNTGYFINNEFFYPGDALTDPKKSIKTLALPMEAPWLKTSECIDYALKLKPDRCIPVHDGRLKTPEMAVFMPKKVLEQNGIKFESLEIGKEYELN